MDRDGPGRAHRRVAGGGEELGIDPTSHRRDRRHHPRARIRPDDRAAEARSWRRVRCRLHAEPRTTAVANRTSTTTASTSSTGPRSSVTRRREPHHPRGVRLRRADRHRSMPSPAPSKGRRHSRRRRRSTRCCARARSKGPCTWAWATRSARSSPEAATGFPTNMTLRSLGILRPKDIPPIDRRDARDPPTEGPLRREGRGRDRAGPDGRRGGRRTSRVRRGVAHHPADAAMSPATTAWGSSPPACCASPPLLGARPRHARSADNTHLVSQCARTDLVAARPPSTST
jgi:hypothetical protein